MKSLPIMITALASMVLLAASVGAQTSGEMIAGQPSPWNNAHFVLWAYGAVWGAVALYVWRIAAIAKTLRRDITALEKLVRDEDSTK
jgi:hypothetical protein